jgi:Tol biopolymer transport system component
MADSPLLKTGCQMKNKNRLLHVCNIEIGKRLCFGLILVLLCLPFDVDAAPTGRIAYAVSGFNEKLGRLDFNLHMTTFTEKGDFKTTSLNQSGMYPAWGPKGDTLYFIQRAATESNIFSIDINNPRNKTQLTQISGTYRFLAVSPNGKKLAFNGWTREQQQQENQIWILDIDTGEMEAVTAIPHFGRTFFFWGISWAPNSKQLAFSLERPGGLEQLYLLDIETKEIEILTENNIDFYPVWSPDGQNILFRRWSREFDTMSTIDVETRAIKPLFDVDKQTGMWTDWSFDGQSIIYSRWGAFYLHDLLTSKTEQLFEVDGSIFVISWWRHEVLPVAPKQKLTTTWGEVKRTLR